MSLTATSHEQITRATVEAFEPSRLDRCDGCGSSRAYVRVSKNNKDLLFCKHHYTKFQVALLEDEWQIQDRTDILDSEIEAYNKPREDDNF